MGIVSDQTTNEPLPNVNIYISNTAWGTSSKTDGTFTLSSIIPGNHEIVFSMIGYDTKSQVINLEDTSKIFLQIELIPKIYKFAEITVTTNRPDGWFDDLVVFKKKFFGYSPNSFDCKIVNEYDINFLHSQETILIAESDYPIEVFNYALGYHIKCEIKKFEYDWASNKLDFNYHLFFRELDTSDTYLKEEWKSNRLTKYIETLPFFLRSLAEENFRDEGFEVSLVHNPGYPGPGLEILSASKIISKDTLNKTCKLSFQNYLKVIHGNIRIEGLSTSWIKLNYPFITIDKYGYPLEENALTILGYWSKTGVAGFLPKYYGFDETD